MIQLVFVACLNANSTYCEERHLLFVENMSPMACMMQAQPELAKWANEHPKWKVSKWRCQNDDVQRATL